MKPIPRKHVHFDTGVVAACEVLFEGRIGGGA